MKLLIEVIKMVVEKYIKNISLIVLEDTLVLEYYVYKDEERCLFKAIDIEEFGDKLKVSFSSEKIERIVDLKELEDIIRIFDKQSKSKKLTQEQIKYIKNRYTKGTKVELIKMYDYINSVPPKTKRSDNKCR